jgi:hypothetical protein
MIMSDLISRQVLELWNRYKPTIAVDAIEYDRELKKLLSTNLASLGTDCISRQAAIDALRDATFDFEACKTVLEQLPPAQPKRGKWIIKDDTERFIAQCNCCRYIEDSRKIKNFCPNCGADMREVTT